MDNETTHESGPAEDVQMQPAPSDQAPRGLNSSEKVVDGTTAAPTTRGGPTPRKSPASQSAEIGRKGKPSTIRPDIPFAEKRYLLFSKELGLTGTRRETVRDFVTTMLEKASDRALLRLLKDDKEDASETKQM